MPQSTGNCSGISCRCHSLGYDDESHGEDPENPCIDAQCDHCGWFGWLPQKPTLPDPVKDVVKNLEKFTATVAGFRHIPGYESNYACAENENCGECQGCVGSKLEDEAIRLGRILEGMLK